MLIIWDDAKECKDEKILEMVLSISRKIYQFVSLTNLNTQKHDVLSVGLLLILDQTILTHVHGFLLILLLPVLRPDLLPTPEMQT